MTDHPIATLRLLHLLVLSLLASLPGVASAAGEVSIPLSTWEGMVDRLDAAARPDAPPERVLRSRADITGAFHRGVFEGTLSASFRVLGEDDEHVRVPVLDSRSSIREVRLDGRPTSLLAEGHMYTVGVDSPGDHRIEVAFLHGRDSDRFTRRLQMRLPPSGATALAVAVDEHEITAKLDGGAITAVDETRGGSVIRGQLDARGALDLTWSRRVTHQADADVRTEATVNTLFTLHEALVRGVTVIDTAVLEGEIDRIDLTLPEGVEVVDVVGDDVLQWRSETGGVGVLLRYLVSESAAVSVHFQYPIDLDEEVALRQPMPAGEAPITGAIGVQGPAGLQVEVAHVAQAQELAPRELPPELTGLTSQPLLLGFGFSRTPEVRLGLERHSEIALTSTIIDDIQGSTMVLEDGTEIAKVRLRMRNNTRQYLSVVLPQGSELTQSMVDGRPIRPGVVDQGATEALLVPLRQSERLPPGQGQRHRIQAGETLGAIARHYYSDATRWNAVFEANPGTLYSAGEIPVGAELVIPGLRGAMEETSFVVELAWRRQRARLGPLGRIDLQLPTLDVDAMTVNWHIYLPHAIEPLAFSGNLTQHSHIRYDPVRRLRMFLSRALRGKGAWAGSSEWSGNSEYGQEYQSILTRRKSIYRAEQRVQSQEVLSSFPLVGERYRFKRILAGRETPQVALRYITAEVIPWVRWGAAGAALVLALIGLQPGEGRRRRLLLCLPGVLALLVLGHHILGVHRRLLWALDLALLVHLAMRLRRKGGPSRLLADRRAPLDLLSWRTLFRVAIAAFALMVVNTMPLLLSTTAFLILTALSWRRA